LELSRRITMNIVKKCKDCGAEFTITEENKKWYEEKGLNIPVRCEACRKKRKAKNNGGK
jgi:predicted RNA-binding Zn-ribbon protein involved in translation (DUF1610 family)